MAAAIPMAKPPLAGDCRKATDSPAWIRLEARPDATIVETTTRKFRANLLKATHTRATATATATEAATG